MPAPSLGVPRVRASCLYTTQMRKLSHHQVGRNGFLSRHLFHEEGSAKTKTCIAQVARPLRVHLARTATTLTAADDPARRIAVEDNRTQHWFNAGKRKQGTKHFTGLFQF